MFLGTKWLFCPFEMSPSCPLCSHTTKEPHFLLFFFTPHPPNSNHELQRHLWVSVAVALTGSGYFVPQTLTTYQAGSWPAEDPCLRIDRPLPVEGNMGSDTLLREVLP